MAFLYRNREAPFTAIRDALDLTGGNLVGHVAKLEEAGYVQTRRVLARVFEVRYVITDKGREAFRAYVDALQDLIALADGAP
ncbi:MAG TPA: transcriptional regulator [Candidatus Thermoplasmatota archaeon]|nr:transcriptional regulator [Candidatus Thermoplasmatota archaeon]